MMGLLRFLESLICTFLLLILIKHLGFFWGWFTPPGPWQIVEFIAYTIIASSLLQWINDEMDRKAIERKEWIERNGP